MLNIGHLYEISAKSKIYPFKLYIIPLVIMKEPKQEKNTLLIKCLHKNKIKLMRIYFEFEFIEEMQ